jgi:leader peptidase (prepilin peptidase)/N-methyltransferase
VTVTEVPLVVGCGLLGVLAGAIVPGWVARLPEPPPVEGETKVPYADLARRPGLAVVGGAVLAPCFGLLAWRLGADAALPAVLYVATVGVLLGYVDLRVRLLPNAVVLPSYGVVIALLTVAAAWSDAWGSLLRALAGGVALWVFLAFLGVLAPSGMGFGDVKLGGVLGITLGWFGLAYVVVGILVAFVLGGLVSLGLVLTRRATRTTAIPFGPFLVLGFVFALLGGDVLLAWYLGE